MMKNKVFLLKMLSLCCRNALEIIEICICRIPGDFNNDCKVDALDFNILVEHWLEDVSR
jgi:hypothetical protein